MGTLITLTAEEACFLALFSELSVDRQALLRAAIAALIGLDPARGAQ